jgi:hypothetical protein
MPSREAANAAQDATLTTNERILRDIYGLYVDASDGGRAQEEPVMNPAALRPGKEGIMAICSKLGMSCIAPRRKINVMIVGVPHEWRSRPNPVYKGKAWSSVRLRMAMLPRPLNLWITVIQTPVATQVITLPASPATSTGTWASTCRPSPWPSRRLDSPFAPLARSEIHSRVRPRSR